MIMHVGASGESLLIILSVFSLHTKQIKQTSSGGEKVMASEVERALLSHPAVAHAAVVGDADPRLGERVVAFVVPRGDAGAVDGEELRRHCRGRLAGYKVPKEVRVVGALPMTASGKVMKGRLKREQLLGRRNHKEEERSFL